MQHRHAASCLQIACSAGDAWCTPPLLYVTFLSSLEDGSGNGLTVTHTGGYEAEIGASGVHFDGNGDYVTVETFDYASDGTFSVSLWFTKEQCTGSIYEYLFSHHNNAGASTWDASYVDIYLGCESAGGGWSTTEGTVLRHWVRDVAGTEAMFDFSLR